MSTLTSEERSKLLALVVEARARGDEAEASRLLRSVPLSRKMAEVASRMYGKEALLEAGFNLSALQTSE